jgi:hypothetical protein
MERNQEITEKILKLKLSKDKKANKAEIQKLQQEYDSLVIEDQTKSKSK